LVLIPLIITPKKNSFTGLKSPTKCDVFQQTGQCDKFVNNKKCIEHSYRCEKCVRLCDYVKCGNYKRYVPMNHDCFMLKKDLKTTSENKYSMILRQNWTQQIKKHTVNYCLTEYFNEE